jgi:alkylated DNA repair dioxygenase AlkB
MSISSSVSEISGLYYFPNLITDKYISQIESGKWFGVTSSKNSRKVQHFGYYYDYSSKRVDIPSDPIPDYLQDLINIANKKCQELKLDVVFNQIIINRYEPGQGINPHIDHKGYGPVICCFSLNSGSILEFTRDETYEIYLEPNSMYIMSTDARYKFTHCMPARKTDSVDGKRISRKLRYSVTLRHVPTIFKA